MFLRMNAETFDELLHLIRPDLEKQTTHLTDPIPPHFKLAAATTRFLYTILKKKSSGNYSNIIVRSSKQKKYFNFKRQIWKKNWKSWARPTF